MQQTENSWIGTLAHLFALADGAHGVRRDAETPVRAADESSFGGEAFIEPRKAHLSGYLRSHLNYAGELVDLFLTESGRLSLITNHPDGSLTVDGVRYGNRLEREAALST